MEPLQQACAQPEGAHNTSQPGTQQQQQQKQQFPQLHAPQQWSAAAQQQPKQAARAQFGLRGGGTSSGSSTFSSEPTGPGLLDPLALFTTTTQLQLQPQPTLSRDPSCQSNELGPLLDSNFITEAQLQQQLRQQQQPSTAGRPALLPLMLPTALSAGDLSLLDPQQRQLLRQLSNSTQHSGQSQPNGDLGTSTSGGTGSPDGAGQPGTAGGFNTSPANSSQTPAAEEEQAADSGKYALPVAHLKVSCGDMVGVLLVHKARIRIYEGTEREKEVSPTEFERLGGRSATKKWKQSIRLIGEDGGNGRPVGEWYVQMGLEAPKKPRDKDVHNASSPAVNIYLDRHERHHKQTVVAAAAAAAAAAAPTPRTRALRAARHSQAAAAKGRQGKSGEDVSAWDDAAAMGGGSGSGSGSIFPPEPMGAWGSMYQQQQQQQRMPAGGGIAGGSMQFPPGTNPLAIAGDPSAVALDAAALGWAQQHQQQHQQQQRRPMEATAAMPAAAAAAAYAAAVSGEVAVVPTVSGSQSGLPGDTSLAVIEMGAYLQGLRSTPPWRLLPINQRPLIGRQLVPLRQLFIMVLHLGGYHNAEHDERLWQEIAIQLEMPAWPTPEVPDPIRILQQVYRDYLLRFETRFGLQQAPPGTGNLTSGSGNPTFGGGGLMQQQQTGLAGTTAAGGGGSGGGSGGVQGPVGRQDHSPALSTATTQYNAAAGGGAVAPGSLMAGLASALGGGFPGGGADAAGRVPVGLMQLPVLSGTVSGMGDIFLDRSLSGDILDALTDLIPMPHDPAAASLAAAAAAREPVNGSGSSGSGSGNGSSGPDRPGSLTLVQAMAAQEFVVRQTAQSGPAALVPTAGTAAGTAAAGPSAGASTQAAGRQQAAEPQRRKQLLQQLQAMASEVTAGAFAGGSSNGNGSRLKRPPPLIRAGDSDLVNLMDQADVERILREHEEQRQLQQQALAAGGGGAQAAGTAAAAAAGRRTRGANNLATRASGRTTAGVGGGSGGSSAAAAAGAVALSEALDADMQDMLEGYLQQHDTAQQQQQQQQQQQPPQQQQQPPAGGAPQARQAEEAVSGMLEALQIEQQAAAQQAAAQQQQQQQRQESQSPALPGVPQQPLQHQLTGEFLPQQCKLHMQQSVGAHLMSDLLQQTGVAAGGAVVHGGPSPGSSSGLCPGPMPRGSAAAAQADEAALQAFAGGLLRLTTPNSALLGSVLESPTHKAGVTSQWMDLPTTSLEATQRAEGQQQQPQQQQQQGQGQGLMSLW